MDHDKVMFLAKGMRAIDTYVSKYNGPDEFYAFLNRIEDKNVEGMEGPELYELIMDDFLDYIKEGS